jgi:hypothetical protein
MVLTTSALVKVWVHQLHSIIHTSFSQKVTSIQASLSIQTIIIKWIILTHVVHHYAIYVLILFPLFLCLQGFYPRTCLYHLSFIACKASTPWLVSVAKSINSLVLLSLNSEASTLWAYCFQEHQLTGARSINPLILLFLIPRTSTIWSYSCCVCKASTPRLIIQCSYSHYFSDSTLSVFYVHVIPHATHLMPFYKHSSKNIVLQQYLCVVFMLSHMQVILSHAFYNPSSKHTSHSASTLSVLCVHVIS